MSATTQKLYSLEAARGIAALLVALLHCGHLMRVEHFSGHVGLNGIFDFGYIGVDFFFVLSGFIITWVHYPELGKIDRLGRYLWRRLTRIFPIYWLSLLISAAVLALGRLVLGKNAGLDFSWLDLPSTVLLLPIQAPKLVEVAWSLQFELLFYLIFCLLFFFRRLGFIMLSLWAVGIVIHQFISPFDLPKTPLFASLLSAHCLQFLCGIVTALILHTQTQADTRGNPKTALIIGLIGCISIGLAEVHQLLPAHAAIGRLLLGLSSSWLLFWLVKGESAGKIHAPLWLSRLGSSSYSIYLLHILFMNLTFMILAKIGLYHALPEVVVFAIALIISVSSASYIGHKIELPMVQFLKQHSPS